MKKIQNGKGGRSRRHRRKGLWVLREVEDRRRTILAEGSRGQKENYISGGK